MSSAVAMPIRPEHLNLAFAYRKRLLDADPWHAEARSKQLPPPGDWRFWLLMAGRGFGKTRTGAEFIRAEVMAGRAAEIGFIAATASDVRDVVVEGPSGIIKVCERYGMRAHYEPSKQRITFPNGAIARTRSADEPDRIRGPEFDLSWWDELGTWKHRDAYTNADFGLRRLGPKGHRARAVVTFTPKPTKIVKELVGHPASVVITGHTKENAANLDPVTLDRLRTQYENTRLGRQELAGELLTDTPGALWSYSLIDDARLPDRDALPALKRIVVAVDPAVSAGDESNETGIVVAGIDNDGDGYVLDDVSGVYLPTEWANAAVGAYRRWKADRLVAEKNQGGDMVESTVRMVDKNVSYVGVHASRGKYTRAEPVSALYEQRRVHHVGAFPDLEDQMTSWVPGLDSPDRMDALVWGLTDLMVRDAGEFEVPDDAMRERLSDLLGV